MILNTNDRISLRLHIECCKKLRKDNNLLNIIKDNQCKLNNIHINNPNTKEWNKIIETNDIDYIIKNTIDRTSRGQLLRSTSPFSGVIPFNELKDIKKNIKKRYYAI